MMLHLTKRNLVVSSHALSLVNTFLLGIGKMVAKFGPATHCIGIVSFILLLLSFSTETSLHNTKQ